MKEGFHELIEVLSTGVLFDGLEPMLLQTSLNNAEVSCDYCKALKNNLEVIACSSLYDFTRVSNVFCSFFLFFSSFSTI